ncbi:hypothetical protein GCM10010315_04420 [Streptomyces luteosporeus]|uniref:Uncharacterized protein n=1 Tax=Streptomyces luteosporeus TaxID=173856 RepID=A0ABN3TJL1_9ACTN
MGVFCLQPRRRASGVVLKGTALAPAGRSGATQGSPAVPAQRKALREYENWVSALALARPCSFSRITAAPMLLKAGSRYWPFRSSLEAVSGSVTGEPHPERGLPTARSQASATSRCLALPKGQSLSGCAMR